MCAAPVTYCRNLLSTSTSAAATTATAQVVLTNAACANAATGDLGMADALRSAEEVAKVRKK
jgi:N-acetylglutamate synthase/N-acetylornithine aminotransferase